MNDQEHLKDEIVIHGKIFKCFCRDKYVVMWKNEYYELNFDPRSNIWFCSPKSDYLSFLGTEYTANKAFDNMIEMMKEYINPYLDVLV